MTQPDRQQDWELHQPISTIAVARFYLFFLALFWEWVSGTYSQKQDHPLGMVLKSKVGSVAGNPTFSVFIYIFSR